MQSYRRLCLFPSCLAELYPVELYIVQFVTECSSPFTPVEFAHNTGQSAHETCQETVFTTSSGLNLHVMDGIENFYVVKNKDSRLKTGLAAIMGPAETMLSD